MSDGWLVLLLVVGFAAWYVVKLFIEDARGPNEDESKAEDGREKTR